MQQVFIDLGSHYGAILNRFARSKSCRPGCIFHAFEANPKIPESAFLGYPKGTIVHREAAGTFDGEIPLYINTKTPTIQGSSIFKEKTTGDLDTEHPVMVRSIDFSLWLIHEFSGKNCEIIIKCNIEGAEYPLIEKMHNDNSLALVHDIRLKRHWKKILASKQIDDELTERLMRHNNLTFSDSYEF